MQIEESSSRRTMALLVTCALLVAVWQILAARAARPWEKFTTRSDQFKDLAPELAGWTFEHVLVDPDPLEPNIISYKAHVVVGGAGRETGTVPPVLARVAHGYNMVDCMRIKHYEVRSAAVGAEALAAVGIPCQVWDLTSDTGDRSIWITTMLQGGTYAPLSMDVRELPFPRIGTPDDPGWNPSGFKLSSLRHPWRNLRMLLRARWNSARCDPLTFLRLRQPAYMSDQLLTLVTTSPVPQGPPQDLEARVEGAVRRGLRVHGGLASSLAAFGQTRETRE